MLDISTEVRKAEKEIGAGEKLKQSLERYASESSIIW